jgi:hypothetical protein
MGEEEGNSGFLKLARLSATAFVFKDAFQWGVRHPSYRPDWRPLRQGCLTNGLAALPSAFVNESARRRP